jgi:uncharacterized protein (PEP-CTERM system associated)
VEGAPGAAPAQAAPGAAPAQGPAGAGGALQAEGPPPRWQFDPTVSITETFTDNVAGVGGGRASTPGGATRTGVTGSGADLINRFSAGLRVLNDGPRSNLTFGYVGSYDKYLRTPENDGLRHDLLGQGRAELVRDFVFVNAVGSVSEELIDSRGPTSATNREVSGNDATVASFSISPSARTNIAGGFATAEASTSFGYTSSGDTGPSSGQRGGFSTRLASGPDFQVYRWALTADLSNTNTGSETTIGGDSDTKRQTYRLQNTYAWSRHLSLIGTVGYEDIDNPTSTIEGGLILEGGIELTGARSQLRLTYNKRFNSTFPKVDARYDIGEGSQILATYDEDLTTEQEQRLDNLGNVVRAPDGRLFDRRTGLPFTPTNQGFGIDDGFGDNAFRQRRGTIGLNWARLRNTYTALLSFEERTGERIDMSERTYIASVGFNRAVNERTSLTSSASYERANDKASGVSRSDDTYRLSATVNYDLGPTVRTSLAYSLVYRSSSDVGNDHENAVILRLTKSF